MQQLTYLEIFYLELRGKWTGKEKTLWVSPRTQLQRYNSPNSGRNKMMRLVTIRLGPCCKSANDVATQCTNR